MDHDETVRREFGRQAEQFGRAGLSLTRKDLLDWIVKGLDLEPGGRVLDVAAGTGLLGRALARKAREVVAVDATPEMLAEGRKAAAGEGVGNIVFEEGRAESLRFGDGSFDAVVCRLAFHHFSDSRIPVREMARVCRAGGTVGLVDLVAPADPALAERYNSWERLRDPSHVRALPAEELRNFFLHAGLSVRRSDSREIEVDLENWLRLASPAEATCERIRRALFAENNGGLSTGLRPFCREGRMMFRQEWIVIAAAK